MVRLTGVQIMGFKDEDLVPVHVGEVRPAVTRVVTDYETLVRRFRLARDVHHGIGFDQI
jgi:hypothetical protein